MQEHPYEQGQPAVTAETLPTPAGSQPPSHPAQQPSRWPPHRASAGRPCTRDTVVLHAAHDRLPFRNQRAYESEVVHLFQPRRRAGVLDVAQDLQEVRSRFWILAQGHASGGRVLRNQVGRSPTYARFSSPASTKRRIISDGLFSNMMFSFTSIAPSAISKLGSALPAFSMRLVAQSTDGCGRRIPAAAGARFPG